MPARNALKVYLENSFYHLYNRGVEKRDIFLDEEDYKVFLYFLKSYLLPKEKLIDEIKKRENLNWKDFLEKITNISALNNFYQQIDLVCFCLMPNHFHLLLRQKKRNGIEVFMRSLITRYVKYFNKKYQRVGPLFQGRYKATLIDKDEYFLHVSRYIHLNAKEVLSEGQQLVDYRWSSYPAYVKGWKLDWLKKDLILSYFERIKGYGYSSYQGFVEGYQETSDEETVVFKRLMIDF